MEPLDFLKSSNIQSSQPGTLDEIFELAAKNAEYRPLFYRTFPEARVYLLVADGSEIPTGTFLPDLKMDIELSPLFMSDGSVPVFTKPERIYDNGAITGPVKYIALPGGQLLEMFNGEKTLVINPNSNISHEFSRADQLKLMTGEIFKTAKPKSFKSGSQVTIGIPEDYPTELVEALVKYCETRMEITETYFGLMQVIDPDGEEEVTFVIGVDVAEEIEDIYGEIGASLRPHLIPGEYINIINVSFKDPVADLLRQKHFKVY